MKYPSRVFSQLHSFSARLLDRAFHGFDGSVEVLPGDLESGFFGLADLFGDLGVFGFEVGVVLGRGADTGGISLVLTGVGSDVGQDAELGDVGVVFGAEAFEFWMDGFVAGAG